MSVPDFKIIYMSFYAQLNVSTVVALSVFYVFRFCVRSKVSTLLLVYFRSGCFQLSDCSVILQFNCQIYSMRQFWFLIWLFYFVWLDLNSFQIYVRFALLNNFLKSPMESLNFVIAENQIQVWVCTLERLDTITGWQLENP